MDIRSALLADRSKFQVQKIAYYIGNDQDRFDQLMDLFINDEPRVTQRAGWVVSHCFDEHPGLVDPHIKVLWHNLKKPQHNAVRRNTLRIFQDYPLPRSLQGLAATLCFDFLADPQEAIAVRVFSMSVLYQLGLQEPDLMPELKLLIEEVLPHSSPGMRSRGMRILKQIKQLQ